MPVVINLDVMLAKKKISVSELCERSGVSATSISMLKTGKARGVRFRTLSRICMALKCTPCELFEIVDNETYRELFHRDWDDSEDDDE